MDSAVKASKDSLVALTKPNVVVGVIVLGTGLGTRSMITNMFNTEIDGIPFNIKNSFGLQYEKVVSSIPLVDDVMWTLVAFGILLIIISACGLFGAAFDMMALLCLFVFLVICLILVLIIVTAMFLNKDSSLVQNIKEKTGNNIKENYKHVSENTTLDPSEAFTRTINSLNILSCFDKIFKMIEDRKGGVIFPFIITLLILVSEIVFAVFVIQQLMKE